MCYIKVGSIQIAHQGLYLTLSASSGKHKYFPYIYIETNNSVDGYH